MVNDNLTVGQHLRYFAAAYRLPSLQRADELADLLGFGEFRDVTAGALSGGTRQKLNLTLALLHDPDVLLLDEPYQGFDWETYLRFWDVVGDLRARGKAIVIITHLVFEQDRFDVLADLAGGRLPPPPQPRGNRVSAADLAHPAALAGPSRPAFRQFPTAWRFAVRNQTRNRLAGLLLAVFVPVWYLLMLAIAGHQPLKFRLYATGQVLTVDAGHLTLISAGLNSLTIIVGFAVFAAIRKTLAFDTRLVFAGYRQATLIAAKTWPSPSSPPRWRCYTAGGAAGVLAPRPGRVAGDLGGFAVIALTYGSLGLLLGVLVKNDLEGFFLIIMGGLMDTFLQNPLGNPLANKPILEWFPSFGPMQFAVGGSFGHQALWGHLALGLAWAAAFAAGGLIIFQIRTRSRRHPAS